LRFWVSAHEQGNILDESKKTWLNAIKEDDIDWIQVLNNEDIVQSDLIKLYGVTAFPTKILLDQKGKIIANYTDNDHELDAKLVEIFK